MKKVGLLVALIILMASKVYAQAVETLDINNDGRPDVWFYDVDAGTKRIDRDSDFDGRVDESTWLHGEHDVLLRMEHDYDYDGVIDEYWYYTGSEILKKELDTNKDGDADIIYIADGDLMKDKTISIRIEADTNYDGTIDVRQEFKRAGVFDFARVDHNNDGRLEERFDDEKELNIWLELYRTEFARRFRALMKLRERKADGLRFDKITEPAAAESVSELENTVE